MSKLQKLHLVLSGLSVIFPKTTNTLKVIGAIVVLKKIVSFIISLYKTLIRPRINFKQRYGRRSWAFITGSSDGIGKAIAF